MITTADAAAQYNQRKWKPIPVSRRTKKALGKSWQHRAYEPNQFDSNSQNVGVQLGEVSGGLVDVDLDSIVAIGLAPEFLPQTDALFGRKSKPCSHQLYVSPELCALDKAAIQFKEYVDGKAGPVIVELRVGGNGKGAVSVFPPSAGLWGKAGQRSMARAALLEGTEQLKRAVDQIAILPPTPALRGKEIKLQVGFAQALMLTGNFVDCKEQCDRALAIYDPAERDPLTTRSGAFTIAAGDVGVALVTFRSGCLWMLGYPAASRGDVAHALKNARETGQATKLMALFWSGYNHFWCRNYAAANTQLDELIALADESGALIWKALGTAVLGSLFAVTGRASDAVRAITSGIISLRSTGTVLYEPFHLWHLAMAYADLGQLDDAWRCLDDAIEKAERSQEKWCEAEVHRVAGEIAIGSPLPNAAKAETHFDRALAVARAQCAKSLELRAAMSMARLWRDQGKRDEARELLAPVYGWFTEGFDTRDLKEAKGLLDELAA